MQKGLTLLDESVVPTANTLKSMCGEFAAVQVDKQVQDLQALGRRVELDLRANEKRLNTTVSLVDELNTSYQVTHSALSKLGLSDSGILFGRNKTGGLGISCNVT